MSEEKKFKLDELPDKGSSHLNEAPKIPKLKVKEDPRVVGIGKLTEEEKLKHLSVSWRYDKKIYHFEWVLYVAVLIVLEYEKIFSGVAESLRPKTEDGLGAIGFAIADFFLVIPFYLVSHPSIFALLTPLLFKFRSSSPFGFMVTYDGLETVKNLNLIDGKNPDKVKIKWAEIVRVEKGIENKRNVLILHGHELRLGLIIWDIKKYEKQSIEIILKGLIPATHPFRKFIEKDIS